MTIPCSCNWKLVELNSMPKPNSLLLLIIFIVDQCIFRSPSSLCWANHVFHTLSLLQQPTQTWKRAQRLPILSEKRGPEGPSNYRLSFDKAAWLHNPLVFPPLVVLFVFTVISYLFGTLLPTPFCTMCLRLWRRREGAWVSKWEKGGVDGACTWEQCGFSRKWVTERESEGKSERDAQRLPKKTVFLVWMPVEFRNHAITIWKDSSHDLSLSFSFTLSFTVSLSQTQCTIIWLNTEVFPATIYLTKPSVLSPIFC